MENENKEYEIIEEKSKFIQRLNREDMINFNDYLIVSRNRNSFFNKIIGGFIAVLGVSGLIQNIIEQSIQTFDFCVNILCILIGVYFFFFLSKLTTKLQKKAVRKQFKEDFKELIMNVTINNEGIGFELLENESEEIVEGTTVDEQLDEGTEDSRFEDQTYSENESEELVEEIETEEETVIEETKQPKNQNEPNVFTIPWGGITRIDDDGEFMFINMVRYQSLLIKKADCPNIEEVVEYAKEKLVDEKRYREINAKG